MSLSSTEEGQKKKQIILPSDFTVIQMCFFIGKKMLLRQGGKEK